MAGRRARLLVAVSGGGQVALLAGLVDLLPGPGRPDLAAAAEHTAAHGVRLLQLPPATA